MESDMSPHCSESFQFAHGDLSDYNVLIDPDTWHHQLWLLAGMARCYYRRVVQRRFGTFPDDR